MLEAKVIVLSFLVVVVGTFICVYRMEKKEKTVTDNSGIAIEVTNPIANDEQVRKRENEKTVCAEPSQEQGDSNFHSDVSFKTTTQSEFVKEIVQVKIKDTSHNLEHDLHSEYTEKTHTNSKKSRVNSEDDKVDLENEIESIQKKIKFLLGEIEHFTNVTVAKLSESLNNTDSKTKAQFEKVFTTFASFTNETQGNFSELHVFLKRIQTLVEEDLKPKIDGVNEELVAIQHARDKADQSLKDLQQLIDNRIFPNTFNKGYAIFTFLTVVIFVLFLTYRIYILQEKLEDTRVEVSTLKKEYENFNQKQTYKSVENEVPGRI